MGNYNNTTGPTTGFALTEVLNTVSRAGIIDSEIRKTLVNNNARYALMAGKQVADAATGTMKIVPKLVEETDTGTGYFENFILLDENGNITWRDGSEGLDTNAITLGDRARIPIQSMVGTIPINQMEMDLNEVNRDRIVKIMTAAIEQANQTAENLMGAGAFAAGTEYAAKTLWGTQYWLPNTVTSGSVAGIDQAVKSNYRSYSKNAGSDSFAIYAESYINVMQIGCTFGKNRTPEIVTMDGTNYSRFKQIFRSRGTILLPAPKLTKLGFEGIEFDGMSVMTDANCPTGVIYAETPSLMRLSVVKGCNFKIGSFIEPVNEQFVAAKIKFRGNIVYLDRKPHGKIYGFTTV